MKKMRKGFTLVELLIVIAILAALSAMMATSSSESIDASRASAILNNLQTLKAAAYQMYMERAEVASLAAVANDTDIDGEGTETETVAEVLGALLGRIDIPQDYGIVGDGDHWYVYYVLTADSDSEGVTAHDESAKVKDKLKDSANKAGLYGGTEASATAFTGYYTTTATQTHIALQVR